MSPQAVFLSPHLDDAALSCGGGIARLVAAGVAVRLVSVFTADQAPGLPLSPLASRSHASWGAGDRPFEARRAEDEAAAKVLGAQTEHLGLLDAIYRRSATGKPFYATPLTTPADEDLVRTLPAIEESLGASLSTCRDARVLCPMGACGHPDHALVRTAVDRLCDRARVAYYDEYPYFANRSPECDELLDREDLAPNVLLLSAGELGVRIEAIACYVSQLRGLFPSRAEVVREVLSARIPPLRPLLAGAPDAAASRARMAAAVTREFGAGGGERYRWREGANSPFAEASE